MRLAMAHPCRASVESVLRINRSKVPCTRSLGLPMPRLSTSSIVDSQGIQSQAFVVARWGRSEHANEEQRLIVFLGAASQQSLPRRAMGSVVQIRFLAAPRFPEHGRFDLT